MNNLTIVMYHYVRDLKNSRYPGIKGLDINLFKEQINYIRKYYNIISIEEVIYSIDNQSKLPNKSALLTFDDGYSDHYNNVLPILDKYKFKGSFYVPSKVILEKTILDVNKIHFILESAKDKLIIVNDLKQKLTTKNDTLFSKEQYSIERTIKGYNEEIKPNVIFICLESFNADFMQHFGNTKSITPNLDRLLAQSISFENIYANGTRTVRGMEAIVLSIPPSPGRSIVKRIDNTNLHNIGNVFKEKGYSRTFFYGGDGYFDNMNNFFGGNGFDIVDRGRGYLFGDSFTAKRTNIKDSDIEFENAWGVCDEDIYKQVIIEADKSYANNYPVVFASLIAPDLHHLT